MICRFLFKMSFLWEDKSGRFALFAFKFVFSGGNWGGGGQEIGGEGMTGVGTESRKCSGSAQASYTFTRKG